MSEPTGPDQPPPEGEWSAALRELNDAVADLSGYRPQPGDRIAKATFRFERAVRAAALAGTPLPYPEDRGTTHFEGCWRDRGHHNCSVVEVERLRALAGTAPADPLRQAASDAIAVAKGIWHAEPEDARESVKMAAREIIDGLRVALAIGAPAAPTDEEMRRLRANFPEYRWPTTETAGSASCEPSGEGEQVEEVIRLAVERRGAPAAPAPANASNNMLEPFADTALLAAKRRVFDAPTRALASPYLEWRGPMIRPVRWLLALLPLLAFTGEGHKVVSVTITPSTMRLEPGDSVSAQCLPKNQFGELLTRSCDWSSSNDAVATTGGQRSQWTIVAGIAPGTATIAATVAGKQAQITVTGVMADTALASLALTPASATVLPGVKVQFSVSGLRADGPAVTPAVTYSATGGTISAGGLYTAGGSAGNYKVIALATGGSGKADTSLVTINPAITPPDTTLASLVLLPASAMLDVGEAMQFSVTGTRADGSSASPAVTYTATGGTISGGGLYTAGQTPGSYRVIAVATGGTKADTSAITLVAAPVTLTRVYLAPNTAALAPAATQVFSVIDSLSDGTTKAFNGSCTAMGGSIISAPCTYKAGQLGGVFPVIAAEGTEADTSLVTVTSALGCVGTDLVPGATFQTLVSAAATGTTFCIRAGVHHQQSVTPKRKDRFLCSPGAIMDGDSATTYAFVGTPAIDSVTIKGCEIRRYKPGSQMGAIKAGDHTKSGQTRGWVIDSVNVHHNGYGGVRLGDQMKLRWSHIHHNGAVNISGIGDSTLVLATEIDYADSSNIRTWPEWGNKMVLSHGLRFDSVYAHHNRDHGLWFDVDDDSVIVEHSRLEDNYGAGAFCEISVKCIFRNDIVKRNGFGRPEGVMGSGLLVAASRDVEIYGNTVDSNYKGIMAFQQARGSGPGGAHEIRNLSVHGNTVRQIVCAGQPCIGVTQDILDNTIFTTWGISWETDTYTLKGTGKYFAWLNVFKTDAEWQGYGNDTAGGSFTRIP